MRQYSVPARFSIEEHDNVAAVVFEHERDDPNFVIYQRKIDGAWTDVTCAEAADQIRSAALGLIALGVQAGDRVSIFSATCYEWAILDLAILAIGAVTVPIYETSSAEQVRWVLHNSAAVLVFAETDAHAAMVTELTGQLPELRRVLHINGSGPKALDQLIEEGASVDKAELDARQKALHVDDPATLIYTSGTTGRPKGCQLTHANLLNEIRGTMECLPTLLNEGQRLLVFLPLAHVLARALTLSAFTSKVTVGFTSDIKNLLPLLAVVQADGGGVGSAGVREGLQHRRAERLQRRQGTDLQEGRPDRGRLEPRPRRRQAGNGAARQACAVRPVGLPEAARGAGRRLPRRRLGWGAAWVPGWATSTAASA